MATKTRNAAIRVLALLVIVALLGGCNRAYDIQTFREKHVIADKLTILEGGAEIRSEASFQDAVQIAAPTAIATATPALMVNNLGVANSLEIRKAATPVFQVDADGNVTGYVLQYGTSGQKIVCSSQTITGTGVLAHGLATPSAVLITIADDVDGDHARVSFTNAAAVVTAKLWNTALTPAAATTPAAIDWCVIGTP